VFASETFREIGTQLLERLNREVPYEVIPSRHFYSTPLIRIRQVVFDWDLHTVLVGMDGVHGEVYILRLSQAESGIVMEERMYVQEGPITLNLNVSLREGLTYTFALYDWYNTQHAIFTWNQSFDFVSQQMVIQEFIELPPAPLAQTNDLFNNPLFFAALLCVIIVTFVTRMFKRERSPS